MNKTLTGESVFLIDDISEHGLCFSHFPFFSSDLKILDKVQIISAISLFSSKPPTSLAEKLKLLLWKHLYSQSYLLLFPLNPALNITALLIGFR